MSTLAALQAYAGRLAALCLAASAAEVALRDEDGALGFRAACRLAVLAELLRMLGGLLR